MKHITLTFSALLTIFFATSSLYAQKDERDGSKKDEKISVIIDGKSHELGDFISDMVESTIDQISDGIDVDFDDDSFDFSVNIDGESWEDWGEKFGKSIENMVNNMEIEITDLDPDDFEDFRHNNDWKRSDGSDVLEEIEEEYDSKVKMIEKIKIKLREDKVYVDVDALLENGKLIHKRIIEDKD